MTPFRVVASFIVVTAVVTGCTSAGGSSTSDGGAASPVASETAPIAAPSIAAPSSAAASSGTSGGGKAGYGYGDATASPAAAGSQAPGSVLLTGFAFAPHAASVAAGSSLAFTNQDSVKHQLVEGENGTPASASAPQSPVAPGQTVSIPFARAGTLTITCTIHPSMNLTVTVTP
jgi:plastocyanin